MIVESKLWHLLLLIENLREEDRKAIDAFTPQGVSEEWAMDTWRSRSFAWTQFNNDGAPVCVVGLSPVVHGVMDLWVAGSLGMPEKVREWLPFIRDVIENILKYTDTHRIECYVLDGFKGAERTIERLGFEREGVRRAAGKNRENAILYAKVKP